MRRDHRQLNVIWLNKDQGGREYSWRRFSSLLSYQNELRDFSNIFQLYTNGLPGHFFSSNILDVRAMLELGRLITKNRGTR